MSKRIKEPIHVGEWLYTIHSLQEGKSVRGEPGSPANGMYVTVNLTLKNLDATIASTASSDMFILRSGGNQYQPDPTASMGANTDINNNFFERAIRAGRWMTGNVVFDVPPEVMQQHCVLQLGDGVLNQETAKIVIIK